MTQPSQQPAHDQQSARAEAFRQECLQRDQPGLRQNEKQVQRILNLDRRPAALLFQGTGEQRPGILEIGNRDHGENARRQLKPAVRRNRRRGLARARLDCWFRSHGLSSLLTVIQFPRPQFYWAFSSGSNHAGRLRPAESPRRSGAGESRLTLRAFVVMLDQIGRIPG